METELYFTLADVSKHLKKSKEILIKTSFENMEEADYETVEKVLKRIENLNNFVCIEKEARHRGR